MKIIFLDIDGVLNSEAWYRSLDHDSLTMDDDIDDAILEMLINYIETHDLKVVITSSWRERDLSSTIEAFNTCKLRKLCPYIIGVTPRTYARKRGTEIDMWLAHHDDINEFAIIDDDDFDIYQTNHLVHTLWETGLTKEDLEKCSKILGIYI